MADLTNEELHVEVAKAGLRLVPADHVTEIENLAKRIDGLTRESHDSHTAALATKAAVGELTDDVRPLLQEIRREIGKVWSRVADLEAAKSTVHNRVTYLETAKVAHAETLTSHDADITGIHKRLVVVEQIVVNKKPRERRKKSIAKGKRK